MSKVNMTVTVHYEMIFDERPRGIDVIDVVYKIQRGDEQGRSSPSDIGYEGYELDMAWNPSEVKPESWWSEALKNAKVEDKDR